jgi:hypothetical protein
MKCKPIITAVFILLISTYCTPKEQHVSHNLTDNHPSCKEFVSSHKFPYQASPERQDQLRNNFSRLTSGLTKAQVEQILGEPDCASIIYSKSKQPGFLGWSWTYFFEKPDPKVTNLKSDKSIEIFIKTNGKAHRITSSVEGLADSGSSSQ